MPKRCRTGCITCRIRRIKCDEGKPSCLRCTSTRRKCDGYEAEQAKDRKSMFQAGHLSPSTIPESPSTVKAPHELRALQHFQTRTASALSASFECHFWNTVLLQVSETQLPVRSAVIAFSSMHESFENSLLNTEAVGSVDESQVLALQEYNKAVRQTAQLLHMKDPTSCRVALISCLLFICLELLQDNYSISINHLMSGLRILKGCQIAPGASSLPPSLSNLHENLNEFFGRIVVQSMFLGGTHFNPRDIPKPPQAEPPTMFSAITDARDMLDGLFLSAYPFLHLVSQQPNHRTAKTYQQTLLSQLQVWHDLFFEFGTRNQENRVPNDSRGMILLEIHFKTLQVMLRTSLESLSTFTAANAASSLANIISLAEIILRKPAAVDTRSSEGRSNIPPSRLAYYSFDLGIIGPLFYIAVKCRSAELRVRAISLLQHPEIPHREGIWNAAITLKMAQRITDVREELIETVRRNPVIPDEDESEVNADDDDGSAQSEILGREVWFDFRRPTADIKKLSILLGTKRETLEDLREEDLREEVIFW